MTNLDCTIEAAHGFWNYLGYVGGAHLFAALHIEGLQLLNRGGLGSVYSSAFYERDGLRRRAKPLSTSALTKATKQGSRANGAVDLTYATRTGNHAEPVALVTNQLLRDLGHAANLADLRLLL
jgi:hypothetical protein